MARFDELWQKLLVDLSHEFRNAGTRSIGLAGKQFADIAGKYADIVKNQAGLARTNAFIASTMREAVVEAYRTNVLATAVAPYRKGKGRFSGGALLTALQSPTMAIGTAKGIGFIDGDLLTRQARFWQRLNYGARPATGSLPQPYTRLQWGANQGFTVKLSKAPRPGFAVPSYPGRVGYFLDNQFFLGLPSAAKRDNATIVGVGRGKLYKTGGAVTPSGPAGLSKHGIGARRFLDAGLVAFVNEFKPAYETYLIESSRTAIAGSLNKKISA